MTTTSTGKSRESASSRLVGGCKACLLAGVITLALVCGGWRVAQLMGKGDLQAAKQVSEQQVVVVASGDTLWSLAIEHGPRNADPRLVVALIREMNNLPDANLKPGMSLVIPSVF